MGAQRRVSWSWVFAVHLKKFYSLAAHWAPREIWSDCHSANKVLSCIGSYMIMGIYCIQYESLHEKYFSLRTFPFVMHRLIYDYGHLLYSIWKLTWKILFVENISLPEPLTQPRWPDERWSNSIWSACVSVCVCVCVGGGLTFNGINLRIKSAELKDSVPFSRKHFWFDKHNKHSDHISKYYEQDMQTAHNLSHGRTNIWYAIWSSKVISFCLIVWK